MLLGKHFEWLSLRSSIHVCLNHIHVRVTKLSNWAPGVYSQQQFLIPRFLNLLLYEYSLELLVCLCSAGQSVSSARFWKNDPTKKPRLQTTGSWHSLRFSVRSQQDWKVNKTRVVIGLVFNFIYSFNSVILGATCPKLIGNYFCYILYIKLYTFHHQELRYCGNSEISVKHKNCLNAAAQLYHTSWSLKENTGVLSFIIPGS